MNDLKIKSGENIHQINRTIAEACGWTEYCGKRHSAIAPGGNRIPILDYCDDLNAIHEAIMCLDHFTRSNLFRRSLANVTGVSDCEGWKSSLTCLDQLTNATARQRAEAFLRMMGKWEEGEK